MSNLEFVDCMSLSSEGEEDRDATGFEVLDATGICWYRVVGTSFRP